MEECTCFIKAVLHVVNETEQRKVICNNFRPVPLDEVQTIFLPVAIPLQSALPVPKSRQVCQLPPGGSQGGLFEFALVHFKWYSAYRRKLLRRDAPSSPFRGGWTRLPGGGAGRPNGLTCAPAGAMQASNRRQAALSESQRGCGRHLCAYKDLGESAAALSAPRWGSWQT